MPADISPLDFAYNGLKFVGGYGLKTVAFPINLSEQFIGAPLKNLGDEVLRSRVSAKMDLPALPSAPALPKM